MLELPSEIIMDNDKATRGLIYTPELEKALPAWPLPEAFRAVDDIQNRNRFAYLGEVAASVFSFRHRRGEVTAAAFWNNARPSADSALVTWPPFTDCAPRSSADTASEYSYSPSANPISVMRAKPNSWRQAIKAATSNDLENVLEDGKVVLAFFSGMPGRVYSKSWNMPYPLSSRNYTAPRVKRKFLNYTSPVPRKAPTRPLPRLTGSPTENISTKLKV
jgi:hypothetical protein